MMSARHVLGLFAALALCATITHAELIDQSGLATTYETILRFDCKMSLQYSPNFNRFVFDDSTFKYFSACKFDNFMWHHAMVSINATGFGFLVVDGEVQDLDIAFDYDDLNLGFQSLGRNFFSTDMYPNRCLEQSGVNNVTAPALPPATDPFTSNKEADQLVSDGFPEVDLTLHPANGSCCSFKIGMRCGEFDAKPFYGFLDEALVYNRPLTHEEIQSTMFQLPQNRKARELEAPRGVQMDLTAGRVFYGRWNNPCSEEPLRSPPMPPPPDEFGEGIVAGRRLLAMDPHANLRRRLLQARQQFISDESGWTAGIEENDQLIVTDYGDDHILFSDFPISSSYVYTGVPWAAPHVDSISYPWDGPLPLDGTQEITISGVGFARSAWMKCVVVPPDPRDEKADTFPRPDGSSYTPNYYWPIDHPPQQGTLLNAPYDLAYTEQLAWTTAKVKFGPFDGSARTHGYGGAEWDATLLDTQFGEITPFSKLGDHLHDPYGSDFIVGYWEEIVCPAPSVPFPSDQYLFGVSNDGTDTMSPPASVTMMDYGASFEGVGVINLPSALLDDMGPTFTFSMWVWPEGNYTNRQTIVEMTSFDSAAGFTGLFWEKGYLDLYLNNDKSQGFPMELGMWHYITVIAADTSQGGQITLHIDRVPFGPTGFIAFSPNVAEFRIGKDFIGSVDQLKIWNDEQEMSVLDKAMFERETDGTLAYFRFSLGLTNHGTTRYDASEYEAGFAYTALPAPWEPTILYTINGMEVDSPNIPSHIINAPMTGGDDLLLTGFNFAPSKFLTCTWGEVSEIPGTQMEASISGTAECDGLVEGQLGRMDKKNITMDVINPLYITPDYTTDLSSAYVDQTVMSCKTPVVNEAGFKMFGPTNKPLMVGYPFAFEDQALHCDGVSGYVMADGAASVGSFGYTVHFWVFPYEIDDETFERRRSLLAEADRKKMNRRQLMEANLGQSVVAFETVSGGNVAVIMYDGSRFFYYDDHILDAPADSPGWDSMKKAAGEWHIITLTVDTDGQGYLYVDDDYVEHFTTTSMPPTSKFSICQDYSGNAPSSFFYGKVDMVRIYNTPIQITDPNKHHLEEDFQSADTSPLAAYWTFTGDYVGVIGAGGPAAGMGMGTAGFVSSDAPWAPPTILAVHPTASDTSAGTDIHVIGINFAKSQWTQLIVGDHNLPFEPSSEVTGVTTKAPKDSTCGDALPVKASNDAGVTFDLEVQPFTESTYTYLATVEDLGKDLLKYFAMTPTVTTASDLDDGVMAVVFIDHMNPDDGTGSIDFLMGADRNSVVNGSVAFSADAPIAVGEPLPEDVTDLTVCAWLFIDSETIHQYDAAAPGFLSADGFEVTGGWKMVSYVRKGEDVHIYVNDLFQEASTSAYKLFSEIIGNMLDTGSLETGSGMISTMWVYGRALKACEVAARYYTSEFAIDTSRVADGADPPAVTLPPGDPTLGHGVTVEMWIYPYETEGMQTLLSTGPEGMDVSLNGNSVSIGVFKGCDCMPCSAWDQHTSWKTTVRTDHWSQIGLTWVVDETSNMLMIFFSVDGIFTEVFEVPGATLSLFGSAENLIVGPSFHGMIYDLNIKPMVADAYELKNDAQCPPLTSEQGMAYFNFNEGGGPLAMAQSGPNSPMDSPVLGVNLAGLWTNSSYDDSTYEDNYSIYGLDRFGVTVTKMGIFSVTSFTACMKRRVMGGDPWSITMIQEERAVETYLSKDTNDGNYHFAYSATTCGDYTTSLLWGEKTMSTWITTIVPDVLDSGASYIMGGVPNGGSFGVPASFTIQAMDSHGCTQLGTDALELFEVTFLGPHDPHPTIVADGDGKYTVHYMPEVAGEYYVTVLLDGEPIKETTFCLTITRGSALQLDGTALVTVPEDSLGMTDLDLDSEAGVTMEVWVKISSASASFLLFKGDDTTEFAKGYDMQVSADGLLSANVYVGLGETRTVSVSIADKVSSTAWIHIAAVYDGTILVAYVNGDLAATAAFETSLPVKSNKYDHPLTMGYGLIGFLDEVKLWKVARSQQEIVMNMYCPPYKELELVAGYFGFNEGAGATTVGHSDACAWDSIAALSQTPCLQGSGAVFSSDTPLTTLEFGMGAPSAPYSIPNDVPAFVVAGSNQVSFNITAKDQCKYCYLGGSLTAFTAQMTKHYTNYITDGVPGPELPELIIEQKVPAVQATGSAGYCPGMGASDGPGRGDMFFVTLNNAVNVGTYYMDIFAASIPFKTIAYDMLVVPAPPNTFKLFETSAALRQPTAGIPFAIYLTLEDEYGNTVTNEYDFSGKFAISDKPYNLEYVVGSSTGDISFSTEDHMYTMVLTLGMPGDYSYTLSGTGMADLIGDLVCAPAPWNKAETNVPVPDDVRRFEHTAEVYNGDLYIFGGASYNKTYLNDMWVLTGATSSTFKYKSYLPLTYSGEVSEGRNTVILTMNTASLIGNGYMNKECMDIMFSEEALPFYIDPLPGCNSAETIVYLALPDGFSAETITVYHGDPDMHTNPAVDPTAVFLGYWGFEDMDMEVDVDTSCSTYGSVPPPVISDEFSYAGKGALYMPGASNKFTAFTGDSYQDYRLRAWFWDAGSVSMSHYLSGDYPTCSEANEYNMIDKKTYHPGTSVGAYSLSDALNYCTSYPWQATEVPRKQNWQLFEIVSTAADGLKVMINGDVVKTGPPTEADRVVISAGFREWYPDSALNASHAYWDEVSALLFSHVEGGDLFGTVVVDNVDGREWKPVPTKGTLPPPRYSHTSVVHGGNMYIFGGERSAYSFNDLWKFEFATLTWSIVKLESAPYESHVVPPPRFDHVAVMLGDKMMVVGGRSGHIFLGDAWVFDFALSNWTQTGDSDFGVTARFGASAAVQAGTTTAYMFGGYSEFGFSNEFFKCMLDDEGQGTCEDITNGCNAPLITGSTPVPAALKPRYSHTSYADGEAFYVFGGSNLEDADGFEDVFKFSFESCKWETVPATQKQGRYEAALAYADGDVFIHGGHAAGSIDGETYMFPVDH